jgi:hypothetical protein
VSGDAKQESAVAETDNKGARHVGGRHTLEGVY